jgi:hypothetical protein
MTRVFILTEDPEVRRFFEAAWEFVSRSVSADVLASLDYAVFTTERECREVRSLHGRVDEFIAQEVQKLCSASQWGMYVPRVYGRPPSCIAVKFQHELTNADNFLALAHEVGHHVIHALDAHGELVNALRRDLPSVTRIAAMGLPERARAFMAAAVYVLASEGAPSYIARNYFARLNVSPEEEFLRALPLHHLASALLLLEDARKECARAGREDIARHITALQAALARAKFESTRRKVHEIAARAFARWPREVFEKNRERYETLFREW